MNRMLAQQLRAAKGIAAENDDTPRLVQVTSMLHADWGLKDRDAEALLRFVHPIQQQVIKADLGGYKQPTELAPELQELVEEMESEAMDMYGGDEEEPGRPSFVFFATLSEEQRQQATSTAYQRAEHKASRLAAAAGTMLGPLQSLSSSSTTISANEENAYGYSSQRYLIQNKLQQRSGAMSDQAISFNAGPIECQITVDAAYYLSTK